MTTLPDYKTQFPQWKAKEWKAICPNLDDAGLDLLKSLLQYAPHKRISARDACSHRFFDDYLPKPSPEVGLPTPPSGAGALPFAGGAPALSPSDVDSDSESDKRDDDDEDDE